MTPKDLLTQAIPFLWDGIKGEDLDLAVSPAICLAVSDAYRAAGLQDRALLSRTKDLVQAAIPPLKYGYKPVFFSVYYLQEVNPFAGDPEIQAARLAFLHKLIGEQP